MAPSPAAQAQTMINNLPEKTGKSLAEWLPLVAQQKLEKHAAIVKYLKQEHQVTHGFANLIAAQFLSQGTTSDADALVDAQYQGAKAELRPIYEKLLKGISKFGKDIEVAPKKAYVSLRRNKQFALIQPSTKTRVDVGLDCKAVEPQGRLEASGSFNSMVSHRVRLESVRDVDQELMGWLRQAYEEA